MAPVNEDWENFEHLDALEGLLEIKSAMTFLTKNRILGGTNNVPGIMVTLVDCTL